MSKNPEVKEIEGILGGLDGYIVGLGWFPGNAALRWLSDSATRTRDIAKDKKQVLKNVKEMVKYIDDLPWAASNAAMRYVKDELTKCLEIYGVIIEKPDYDEPNPQPPEKPVKPSEELKETKETKEPEEPKAAE